MIIATVGTGRFLAAFRPILDGRMFNLLRLDRVQRTVSGWLGLRQSDYALPLLPILLGLVILLPFLLYLLGESSIFAIFVWFIFGSLCLWIGAGFSRAIIPEISTYRQATDAFSRVVQSMTDQEALLDQLTYLLFATLSVDGVAIWRYYEEDNILSLLRAEGVAKAEAWSELPFDLPLGWQGTRLVSQLPGSALRQGFEALDMKGATLLVLGNEIIGLISFGAAKRSRSYSSEMLTWLDLMAGQVALVVKNACLVKDLEETITKLQLAYRRTIDAEQEERRHIAIELHDDILSRLTTMAMTLRSSQRRLPVEAQQIHGDLQRLEQETHHLNGRLREITQGLHPSVLTDLGLVAALQAHLDSITQQSLPASAPRIITLTAQGFDDHRLSEQKLETDMYYITRQAIDNALFHAEADQILIHLRWGRYDLSLTVQDTGIGLKDSPEVLMGQSGHLGLLSMNERTLAWRGRLTFDTAPARGTTVHVRIPFTQPSPALNHLQAYTYYLNQSKADTKPQFAVV
jgi:signal transduction histidine kinase